MTDAKLLDEPARLAALRRYEVLDTPREAPFERVTGLVRAVLNVPIATLTLIDTDRQFYKSCAGMDGSDIPRAASFCTHTIQRREPLFVPDTLLDERFRQYPSVVGEPFIRSYLGVPLASSDGYNLGSLCALDVRPRHFETAQIEVLKSFAALAVDELELRMLAQVDSLTGAATRRSFLLEMEKAIANFARHGKPAALLIVDVDHFKRINDEYGHPAGDEVLRRMSGMLRERLRPGDLLGRLGGEEFGVLLTETELDAAFAIAEHLRLALHDLHHDVPASRPVTASFGVAALASPQIAVNEWLSQADQALYAAKRSGRNRCCMAEVGELTSA